MIFVRAHLLPATDIHSLIPVIVEPLYNDKFTEKDKIKKKSPGMPHLKYQLVGAHFANIFLQVVPSILLGSLNNTP